MNPAHRLWLTSTPAWNVSIPSKSSDLSYNLKQSLPINRFFCMIAVFNFSLSEDWAELARRQSRSRAWQQQKRTTACWQSSGTTHLQTIFKLIHISEGFHSFSHRIQTSCGRSSNIIKWCATSISRGGFCWTIHWCINAWKSSARYHL
jgi:hypothetical protein